MKQKLYSLRAAISVFCLFLLCLSANVCLAQKENNNWVLGNNMALDLSSGTPRLQSSSSQTVEGTAAQSGKNGALMFYSDGFNVYNSKGKVMPNGAGLITDGSMTQGVAIAPHPNDTNLFFVFVLGSDRPGSIQLRYSVVDMQRDKGSGDVTGLKNIVIDDSLSEKMQLTRADGCSYWLIVHSGVKPEFHAFRIGATGLATHPVVSSTEYIGDGYFGIGEMKVAPDNKKIVLANWRSKGSLGSVELFQFDSSSGIVSGYTLIDSSFRYAVYGISFSPDGSKLYAAYGEDEPRPPYALIQYDLQLLPDFGLLRSRRTTLATAYNWGGMRLFRDKIYVLKPANLSMVLCAISRPDEAGLACGFVDSVLVLNRVCFSLGNPVPETPAPVFRRQEFERCRPVQLSVDSSYQFYTWSDGFGESVRSLSPGNQLWLRSSNGACAPEITDTFVVRAKLFTMVPMKDRSTCKDAPVQLMAGINADRYLWNTGDTTASIAVGTSGAFYYTAYSGDCTASDTVEVWAGDCNRCLSAPNAFSPNNDGRNDVFRALFSCPLVSFEMKVFNRFGQQIFATNDAKEGWNGNYGNATEGIETYFYLIRAQFDRSGEPWETLSGDITLIR
jgi:gliding motility-associated-like protein